MCAALAMGLAVMLVDRELPPLAPLPRLAMLVAVGGASYAALLFAFARETLAGAIALVRNRAG